jgi:hypothetical protein
VQIKNRQQLLIIVAMTKATEGAWIIMVMIPVLVTIFEITRRHYDHVASELTLRACRPGSSPSCPPATTPFGQ